MSTKEELELQNEIKILKDEIQDLRMRLSAIKVITTRVEPVCSEKLKTLLESCESCKD